jgi:hypothetical protein
MGKVYEIVCNQTGERYIGSTKLRMCLRKALHKMKTNGCKSRQIIDRDDYIINVLETDIPKETLRQKEQDWLDKLECINDRNAYVPPEVRREAQRVYAEVWYKNPEHKAIKKANYEANRETILAKAKAKYEANKGTMTEKQIAYYETNKEKIRAYQKAYREKKKLEEPPII